MANYRNRWVGREILKEINDILRKKACGLRVENVTITGVKATGDLRQATIYYSILPDLASDKKTVQGGLNKVSGLIRRELGHNLSIHKTPELFFKLDESVVYGSHIGELLRDLNKD